MSADEAYDTLREDPALGPTVEEHGPVDFEPAEDSFRRLVVSVINQQLSGASADAIRERVFERFEITPDALLAADENALRDTGLSEQKTRYVQNIASAYVENDYGPEYFAGESNEAVIEELTEITGVGTWTAKMYLIFCLGREDVFPVEDLGIRKGMEAIHDRGMSRTEMIETAERWRPYRSYASLYLWRAYD